MLFTLWLARAAGRGVYGTHFLGITLVAGLALVSLFYFNRDSNWDNWALYFFGAYALGTLSYWVTEARQQPGWLLVMVGVVGAALVVDFRSRIAVALLAALALGIAQRGDSWKTVQKDPFLPISARFPIRYSWPTSR